MERAKCKMSDCILYCLVIPLTYTEIYSMYCFGAGRSCFYSTLAQAEVEHMMAVLKQKKQKTKKTDETLLTVSRNWSAAMSAGFPLTLRVFHVGHP